MGKVVVLGRTGCPLGVCDIRKGPRRKIHKGFHMNVGSIACVILATKVDAIQFRLVR